MYKLHDIFARCLGHQSISPRTHRSYGVLPFPTAYLRLQGEQLLFQVLSGLLFLLLLLLQVVLLLLQLPDPTAQVEFLARFFLQQLLLHQQAHSKFSLFQCVVYGAWGSHTLYGVSGLIIFLTAFLYKDMLMKTSESSKSHWSFIMGTLKPL